MTMRPPSPRHRPTHVLRLLLAGALGVLAAVLVACGSSGTGLIPAENAGPLESDFLAVAKAAKEGDGSCSTTEAAIRKTEHDLQALPANVNSGLRQRLEAGTTHLSERARAVCVEPLSPSTTTTETTSAPKTTTTKTSPTRTTPTSTSPETESTTETPSTTPTSTAPPSTGSQPIGPGGGAQAPGEEPNGEGSEGKGPAGTGPPGHDESEQGGGTGVGQ